MDLAGQLNTKIRQNDNQQAMEALGRRLLQGLQASERMGRGIGTEVEVGAGVIQEEQPSGLKTFSKICSTNGTL